MSGAAWELWPGPPAGPKMCPEHGGHYSAGCARCQRYSRERESKRRGGPARLSLVELAIPGADLDLEDYRAADEWVVDRLVAEFGPERALSLLNRPLRAAIAPESAETVA